MSREQSKRVYSTEQPVPRTARKENPAVPASGTPAPPERQQVTVRLERKGRGGKTVSVISGLQGAASEREALLKQLKTRLGTGGTVREDVLEIQGDHRDALCRMLQGLGYRPKRSGG
ncbi:MAG: translation initiation factor [Alphaproteobacteria bacterium]|uniref:Translation initiation factor n=1 Tax=Candidatus Nitrobium versatile TaxID=2884831 RepID=A0A953LXF3_9BACT|nr:translation initiation factor [Candidatus Nitrobium versatile]